MSNYITDETCEVCGSPPVEAYQKTAEGPPTEDGWSTRVSVGRPVYLCLVHSHDSLLRATLRWPFSVSLNYDTLRTGEAVTERVEYR